MPEAHEASPDATSAGSSTGRHADVVVVGAGIVGLATAHALLRRRPGLAVHVIEKEPRVASHQSGRNSGVLHSGIYYRPGSLKARMAHAGRTSMVRFCETHGVPYRITGKVIVATTPEELPRLADLEARGMANGVGVTRVSLERLRELEPHARGLAALHVAETGITDYRLVSEALRRLVEDAGGTVSCARRVLGIASRQTPVVETDRGDVSSRVVVNCAGLWSDRLARATDVRIVPFRGEYLDLVPERAGLVQGLIYPVPDPQFPFLGAHFTRSIHGGVHAGPNAVLAFAREGYSWRVVDLAETLDLVRSPGFRVLARRHWRTGAREMSRSLSRRLTARDLARLVPGITARDLVRTPAGVRAQALRADGTLLDDFVVRELPGQVHVVNAPSPAATASLEIGDHVAGLALAHLA